MRYIKLFATSGFVWLEWCTKLHTRTPIAAGMPTVRAIAVVVFSFSVFPNSSNVARWFSFRLPSGNSTSTSWWRSTMSCAMEEPSHMRSRTSMLWCAVLVALGYPKCSDCRTLTSASSTINTRAGENFYIIYYIKKSKWNISI